MEIRTLKYFLAVVKEQGVNRAAAALNVTQPTLSRQMAQLEDELGVKLFERGSRKISLTGEGLFFSRRAEEILSLVEKAKTEICVGIFKLSVCFDISNCCDIKSRMLSICTDIKIMLMSFSFFFAKKNGIFYWFKNFG